MSVCVCVCVLFSCCSFCILLTTGLVFLLLLFRDVFNMSSNPMQFSAGGPGGRSSKMQRGRYDHGRARMSPICPNTEQQ